MLKHWFTVYKQAEIQTQIQTDKEQLFLIIIM